jgi:cellobiose phosphorylase
VNRRFRNKDFHIIIKNTSGIQKGVKRILINGSEIKGTLIPLDKMNGRNEVEVEMG